MFRRSQWKRRPTRHILRDLRGEGANTIGFHQRVSVETKGIRSARRGLRKLLPINIRTVEEIVFDAIKLEAGLPTSRGVSYYERR